MLNKHLITIILGLLVHQGILIRHEWHTKAPIVVSVHLVSFILLCVIECLLMHNGPLFVLLDSLKTFGLYICSLLLSILLYRLYFHRLRGFPGPRSTAISKLWHVWRCCDSRGHHLLEELHKEYGTFVRTGPNEITIFHPGAYEAIDGQKTRNPRSDWYDLMHPRIMSIFSRDRGIHDTRRKIWDRALSPTMLRKFSKRILHHIQTLDHIIDGQGENEFVLNDLMYWYAFDTMGDFGFSADFGQLKRKEWLEGALHMRSAIGLLGPISPAIWIAKVVFAYIPNTWRVRHWFQMVHFAEECTKNRMQDGSDQSDIISAFIANFATCGHEPDGDRLLNGDAAALMITGSDTIAPALIILFYFLASFPEHASKIRASLVGVDITDITALSRLTHLTATIDESMRLLPAVPTFGSRNTPPEGLIVDDTYIPGNTKICSSRYSLARLEAAFEKPHQFIPERWYSVPHLIKDKRAFSPFGSGRTICVGKQLAMAQLRLLSAAILSKYHVELASHEAKGIVEIDMRDQLTAKPGALYVRFKKV